MDIIVTGASGFVGQNLCSFLKGNNLNVFPVRVRYNQIEDYNNFLNNLGANARIIHASGVAHDIKGAHKNTIYKQNNTDLSIQLIDAFLQSKALDFIFISSVKSTVDISNNLVDENTVPHPNSDYGISKLKVEEYIKKLIIPKGKRIIILRPAMIYGADCKGNLPLLFSFLKKGIPYPFGKFQNERSFLNIKNLLFSIYRILEDRSIAGACYMVADDETYSSNSLVKQIAGAAKLKPRIVYIPKFIIRVVARIGDYLSFPLNSKSLGKLTQNLCINNSKIKKVLQIDKMPYNLEEGLKEMIEKMDKKQ